MNTSVTGNGPVKILFIHGWLEAGYIYTDFAQKLDNVEITAVTLPGYGKTECKYTKWETILDDYLYELHSIIENGNFDIIFGHSMGGVLTLKLLDFYGEMGLENVYLCNPVYGEIKFLRNFDSNKRIFARYFRIKDILPVKISRALSYPASLIANTKIKYVNKLFIDAIMDADFETSLICAKALANNEWRLQKNKFNTSIKIFISGKDRIVLDENRNLLKKDLSAEFIYYEDNGHSLINEIGNEILEIMQSDINTIVKEKKL
ncbi:MAG: alpha/beta hydrolase [Lachnospirales bacterium]